MKKTFVTCMAVVALLAVASSAGAITCTVDQRPAATLLIPYFAVGFNPDFTPTTGGARLDTLITIVNASAAPMLAHVNVFNERTELVLDFNIALTGFDVQAMSMQSVLSGVLPSTPITTAHVPATTPGGGDACQRNPLAGVYSPPSLAGEYLRIRPVDTATALDNTLATTLYPLPQAFSGGFTEDLLDNLDETDDTIACGGVDRVISGVIRGYVVIDHANYCNLSNPSDPNYYSADAIGMENNLWGEVIFLSGTGIPTMGGSTVNIEADPSLAEDGAAPKTRTFYGRYFTTDTFCSAGNCAQFVATNPWNQGFGDQREPLGLKYAARWFDAAPTVTSNFIVWRASSGTLTDLLGPPTAICTAVEPVVTLTFFDEDENTVTAGVCPSPCVSPTFNFPLETQRTNIAAFQHPSWPAGWVNMNFFNPGAPNGGQHDQAWVEYDFQGNAAFLSISAPGTQLDPSTCNPLGVIGPPVITPVIPAIRGTGI